VLLCKLTISARLAAQNGPKFKPKIGAKKAAPTPRAQAGPAGTPALTPSSQSVPGPSKPAPTPTPTAVAQNAPPSPPPTLPPTLGANIEEPREDQVPPTTPRAAPVVALPPTPENTQHVSGLSAQSDGPAKQPAPVPRSPPPTQVEPVPPTSAPVQPSLYTPNHRSRQPSVAPSVSGASGRSAGRSGKPAFLLAVANQSTTREGPSPGRIPSKKELAANRASQAATAEAGGSAPSSQVGVAASSQITMPASTQAPTSAQPQAVTTGGSRGATPTPSRGATPGPSTARAIAKDLQQSFKAPANPPLARRSATPQIDPTLLSLPAPAGRSNRPSSSPRRAPASSPAPVTAPSPSNAEMHSATMDIIASIPGYTPSVTPGTSPSPAPTPAPRAGTRPPPAPTEAKVAKLRDIQKGSRQRMKERKRLEALGEEVPAELERKSNKQINNESAEARFKEIREDPENDELSDGACWIIAGKRGIYRTKKAAARKGTKAGAAEDSEDSEVEKEKERERRRGAIRKPAGIGQIEMEGMVPDQMVGAKVDEAVMTLGELVTSSAGEGLVSARGIELALHLKELKEIRTKQRQERREALHKRKQYQRRKVRKERNAEREKRRQELDDEDGLAEELVSPDEENSEEDFDMPPNRLTPPSSPGSGDGDLPDDEDDEEDMSDGDGIIAGLAEAADMAEKVGNEGEDEDDDEDDEDGEGAGAGPVDGNAEWDWDAIQAGIDGEEGAEDMEGMDLDAWRNKRTSRRKRGMNGEWDDNVHTEFIDEDNDKTKMINAESFKRAKTEVERWSWDETEFFYYVSVFLLNGNGKSVC
jgi:transcription factor TFIIIB component B''